MAWTQTKCSLGSHHAPMGCRGVHRYLVRWRETVGNKIVRKSFRIQDEEQYHKTGIESKIDRGEYIEAAERSATLEDYIAGVLAADTALREGTKDFYLGTWRTHLLGTSLGQTAVGRLTAPALREFWSQLEIGD